MTDNEFSFYRLNSCSDDLLHCSSRLARDFFNSGWDDPVHDSFTNLNDQIVDSSEDLSGIVKECIKESDKYLELELESLFKNARTRCESIRRLVQE